MICTTICTFHLGLLHKKSVIKLHKDIKIGKPSVFKASREKCHENRGMKKARDGDRIRDGS